MLGRGQSIRPRGGLAKKGGAPSSVDGLSKAAKGKGVAWGRRKRESKAEETPKKKTWSSAEEFMAAHFPSYEPPSASANFTSGTGAGICSKATKDSSRSRLGLAQDMEVEAAARAFAKAGLLEDHEESVDLPSKESALVRKLRRALVVPEDRSLDTCLEGIQSRTIAEAVPVIGCADHWLKKQKLKQAPKHAPKLKKKRPQGKKPAGTATTEVEEKLISKAAAVEEHAPAESAAIPPITQAIPVA
ncbi:unnamed protein product [Chrysoparadoxa australica]